jgi:hypothetical protein
VGVFQFIDAAMRVAWLSLIGRAAPKLTMSVDVGRQSGSRAWVHLGSKVTPNGLAFSAFGLSGVMCLD